jgi:hypothetical protein
MNIPNLTNRIVGGIGDVPITGVGALNFVPLQKRCFAITVRSQGTIISALTIQNEGQSAPVAWNSLWIGVVLNQGDYIVFDFPVCSITLTAATDSVNAHTDLP